MQSCSSFLFSSRVLHVFAFAICHIFKCVNSIQVKTTTTIIPVLKENTTWVYIGWLMQTWWKFWGSQCFDSGRLYKPMLQTFFLNVLQSVLTSSSISFSCNKICQVTDNLPITWTKSISLLNKYCNLTPNFLNPTFQTNFVSLRGLKN